MRIPPFIEMSEMSLGKYTDLAKAAEAGSPVALEELRTSTAYYRRWHPPPAARLSRREIAEIEKAVGNPLFSTAVPFDAAPTITRVRSDGPVSVEQLGTDVRNPNSAEPTRSGWVAGGRYQHQAAGVGTGADVDPRAHSDVFMRPAGQVERSGRDDPELGQAGQRGADFADGRRGLRDWRSPYQLGAVPVSKSASPDLAGLKAGIDRLTAQLGFRRTKGGKLKRATKPARARKTTTTQDGVTTTTKGGKTTLTRPANPVGSGIRYLEERFG